MVKVQQGRVEWEYFPNFQRIYFSSSSGNSYTVKFYLQNITKRRIKLTISNRRGVMLEGFQGVSGIPWRNAILSDSCTADGVPFWAGREESRNDEPVLIWILMSLYLVRGAEQNLAHKIIKKISFWKEQILTRLWKKDPNFFRILFRQKIILWIIRNIFKKKFTILEQKKMSSYLFQNNLKFQKIWTKTLLYDKIWNYRKILFPYVSEHCASFGTKTNIAIYEVAPVLHAVKFFNWCHF